MEACGGSQAEKQELCEHEEQNNVRKRGNMRGQTKGLIKKKNIRAHQLLLILDERCLRGRSSEDS
jgi:hypothetical protein